MALVTRVRALMTSRLAMIPSSVISSSAVPIDGSTSPPSSGIHSCTLYRASSGATSEYWLPENARSCEPITTASKPRAGSASAASNADIPGRRCGDTVRDSPTSENSTTIRPSPKIVAAARSNCHCRDVTGS